MLKEIRLDKHKLTNFQCLRRVRDQHTQDCSNRISEANENHSIGGQIELQSDEDELKNALCDLCIRKFRSEIAIIVKIRCGNDDYARTDWLIRLKNKQMCFVAFTGSWGCRQAGMHLMLVKNTYDQLKTAYDLGTPTIVIFGTGDGCFVVATTDMLIGKGKLMQPHQFSPRQFSPYYQFQLLEEYDELKLPKLSKFTRGICELKPLKCSSGKYERAMVNGGLASGKD